MAKTAKPKVTATKTSKSLGKAVTRDIVPVEFASRSFTPPITDEKLDKRQLAKGTKRKPHGPKLKQSAITKKPVAAMTSRDVPPTEVK